MRSAGPDRSSISGLFAHKNPAGRRRKKPGSSLVSLLRSGIRHRHGSGMLAATNLPTFKSWAAATRYQNGGRIVIRAIHRGAKLYSLTASPDRDLKWVNHSVEDRKGSSNAVTRTRAQSVANKKQNALKHGANASSAWIRSRSVSIAVARRRRHNGDASRSTSSRSTAVRAS